MSARPLHRTPSALVAFDATHLSRLGAGITTYVVGLLQALYALEQDDWRLRVLVKSSQADDLAAAVPAADLVPVDVASTPRRIVWEQLGLPPLLDRLGASVVHSPHYSLPLRCRQRRVVTVHDLTYVMFPQYHRGSRSWFFRRMIPHAAASADAVLCISAHTRDDLLRLYPATRGDRVRVVPLAAHPRFAEPASDAAVREVRERHGLPDRYVLHVGTIEPRKNLGLALDAVAALRVAVPDAALVLVGQPGWEADGVVARLDAAPFVRRLGHVAADDLPAIYRGAAATIVPSHYEGFGLTLPESMGQGTPVVSSGLGSLAEVGGDAAVVPARLDAAGYAVELARLVTDPAHRAAVAARGRAQARSFTWGHAAVGTAEAYLAVLGGRDAPSRRPAPPPAERDSLFPS